VRVGFLDITVPTFDPAANPAQREFVEGLRELGYTLGREIVVEYKSARGDVRVVAAARGRVGEFKTGSARDGSRAARRSQPSR